MDINYLNFRLNIFGSHSTRLQLFAEDIEKWLNMKLMDLYCEDRIINSSIGCKNEDQENPIYFVLRAHNRISDKTYALYFILNTTKENINQNIYQIIEAKIREEARNNIYSKDNKEVLKLFIEKYGKRTKEEIADIFNEKENNIKQPEIIIPQIVEQEPIVSADIDIETGLIDPKRIPNEYCFPTLESRGVRLVGHSEIFLNIIEMMYSSSAIDGTKGEISDKNLYYDYIIPFSKVKNIYLSDFHNFEYYSRYSQKYEDKNKNVYEYILFCIYEKLKDCPYFVRYLAPIVVDKDSNMTVQDAVNNYYDSISGRVSSRYQKSIEAFQKKYR